jgi:outer membrane lipase/esterase
MRHKLDTIYKKNGRSFYQCITGATPMKSKYLLTAVAVASLLTACGGGGGGTATGNSTGFTQMVSFGDSLSDVGTYKVGTVAALGGGKFTVNGTSSKNWTELIAAQYGFTAPCAAQTGLFPLIPGFQGAAIQNFAACTNYAQGSARVTSPAGPNSTAVQAALGGGAAAAAAAPMGMMAVPLVTQMNTHLTKINGSYTGKELVTVLAGGNDIFMNLNAVSSAAAGGTGAAGAAAIAGWSASVQTAVFAGGAAAAGAAAGAAVQGMGQAGTELAGYVKTLVVAKGAKYVTVLNLPDVSQTPMTVSFDAATKGLINTMVTTFNTALQAGLKDVAGVIVVDVYTQNKDQINNPAQYGLTNVNTAACSATSAANPLQGSSLTCTTASLISGDTSKYAFADSVHPSPYGYQLLAQFVTQKLAIAGWQ